MIKDSIVHCPSFNLLVYKASDFPEGIQHSWNNLEEKIKWKRGRKFYGLTLPHSNKLQYYAGVIPLNAGEVTQLQLPLISVPGGRFAQVKLMDWNDHLDEISSIFEQLISKYTIKDDIFTLEYYKSQKELHLLVPLEMQTLHP